MAQKRRTAGGRVTPSKKALARDDVPSGSGPSRSRPRPKPQSSEPAPANARASSRYTPRKPTYRIRPRWHRVAGWLGIALGVVLALTNDAMLFTENELLPLGHQEFYLLLAFVIAGSSTWFLGLFDRGTTIYD